MVVRPSRFVCEYILGSVINNERSRAHFRSVEEFLVMSGARRREGGPLLSTLSLRFLGPSSARSVVAGMSFPKTLCRVIFTISEQHPGLPSDRLGDGYFIPRVLSMLWCSCRAYSFFAKVCFDFSLLPETDIY